MFADGSEPHAEEGIQGGAGGSGGRAQPARLWPRRSGGRNSQRRRALQRCQCGGGRCPHGGPFTGAAAGRGRVRAFPNPKKISNLRMLCVLSPICVLRVLCMAGSVVHSRMHLYLLMLCMLLLLWAVEH